MSLNLALLLKESARSHPDKTAIVIGPQKLTFAAVDGMARRFAGALAGLGLKPGQHVALLLPNVPQFTIAYFGAHYAGNPVVPLNVLLTGEEVRYHLEDSDAVALVAWEGFAQAALAGFSRADTCKHLILVRASAAELPTHDKPIHDFAALLGAATPVTDLPATNPDDTAVILYTSGTTGRPKGAELTHFNLFFNAHYVRTQLLRMGPETCALATLPLFHSFGQSVIQNAVLGSGGTIILLPKFTPDDAFGLMAAHKVTLFAGVPTMYFALLHHPGADKYDLSALSHCVSGGAPMPVEVMNAFDKKYNVNILEGYGLSETSPVASFNVLDRPKKAGSIGLPIWGVDFRLVKDGLDVGPDEAGEIWIKGHNVMKGYYKRPEANAEVIVNGWFATGDIARKDGEGYYYIVDRKKDMIIRGGFNVYPREVEEVLYGHPAIAEVAVIGVPHESHGEEVKAVVVLKPGQEATPEAIIAWSKELLAAYKYPRVVEIVAALPKNATGKILKRELRG